MKLAVKIFTGLLALAAIGFGALLVFWLTTDASMWRDKITAYASQQLGRTLVIKGELAPSFTLATGFGLTIKDLRLANKAGLQPAQMIELQELTLQVAVLPLLQRQLQVKALSVAGMRAHLWQRGQQNNWTFNSVEKPAAPTAATKPDQAQQFNFSADQINASNVVVKTNFDGTEKSYELQNFVLQLPARGNVQLTLDALIDGTKLALDITAGKLDDVVSGAVQPIELQAAYGQHDVALRAFYSRDGTVHRLNDAALTYNKIKATGVVEYKTGAVPGIVADIKIPDLDIADFTGGQNSNNQANTSTAGVHTNQAGAAPLFSRTPLPWDMLSAANITAKLVVGRFHNAEKELGPVQLNVQQQNGTHNSTLALQPAGAAQPVTLNVQASNARQLGVRLNAPAVDAVLLSNLLGAEPVVLAPAKIMLDFAGRGQSLHEVMSSANGNAQLDFAAGKLNQNILPSAARAALNTLLGAERVSNAALGCFKARFDIANGVASSNGLGFASDIAAAGGAGQIMLGAEQLNVRFMLQPLVAPAENTLLPINITGSLGAPKIGVDAAATLGQTAGKLADKFLGTIGGAAGNVVKELSGANKLAKLPNPCRPEAAAPATAEAPQPPASGALQDVQNLIKQKPVDVLRGLLGN